MECEDYCELCNYKYAWRNPAIVAFINRFTQYFLSISCFFSSFFFLYVYFDYANFYQIFTHFRNSFWHPYTNLNIRSNWSVYFGQTVMIWIGPTWQTVKKINTCCFEKQATPKTGDGESTSAKSKICWATCESFGEVFALFPLLMVVRGQWWVM